MTPSRPHIVTYYLHLPDIPMITRSRIRPYRTVSYVSTVNSTTSLSLAPRPAACFTDALTLALPQRTSRPSHASQLRLFTGTSVHSPWPALTPNQGTCAPLSESQPSESHRDVTAKRRQRRPRSIWQHFVAFRRPRDQTRSSPRRPTASQATFIARRWTTRCDN